MAYIAKTDGTREPIDTPVSLAEAQRIVGGYVERVCPKATPGIIFLCNEDALMKDNWVLNPHATFLYNGSHNMSLANANSVHPIAGDVIVFENRKEAKGWM
jgi:hypothetical protein